MNSNRCGIRLLVGCCIGCLKVEWSGMRISNEYTPRFLLVLMVFYLWLVADLVLPESTKMDEGILWYHWVSVCLVIVWLIL